MLLFEGEKLRIEFLEQRFEEKVEIPLPGLEPGSFGGLGPPSSPPFLTSFKLNTPSTVVFFANKWADLLVSDFKFAIATDSSSSSAAATAIFSPLPPLSSPPSPPELQVSILLHFYRILDAEPHFLGDGIRRPDEYRVSKPPQYGFSREALVSRRQILQAACEAIVKESSRLEYTLELTEEEQETLFDQVPWDKVPGALCVLQECGEAELVLRIGDDMLKERLSRGFKQDVVLAMAYVDLSRMQWAWSLRIASAVVSCLTWL